MSDEVLELDVQVDKKTLNRFLIRNNYMRVGGVFGLLISLAAIAGLVVFWDSFPTSQRVILIVVYGDTAGFPVDEGLEPAEDRSFSQTIPLCIFRYGHDRRKHRGFR